MLELEMRAAGEEEDGPGGGRAAKKLQKTFDEFKNEAFPSRLS